MAAQLVLRKVLMLAGLKAARLAAPKVRQKVLKWAGLKAVP